MSSNTDIETIASTWIEGSWEDEHDALCEEHGIDAEADSTIQCYTSPCGSQRAIVWWDGECEQVRVSEPECTAAEAATEIVDQMSDDDRANFDRDEWFEGVSNMQASGWEHLDTDDILDEIAKIVEAKRDKQNTYRVWAHGYSWDYSDLEQARAKLHKVRRWASDAQIDDLTTGKRVLVVR
jgi:hypothetical protein